MSEVMASALASSANEFDDMVLCMQDTDQRVAFAAVLRFIYLSVFSSFFRFLMLLLLLGRFVSVRILIS